MTVLVMVSDTHRRISAWQNICSHYPEATLLHAGDHELDLFQDLPVEEVERVKAVRGNCDFASQLPAELLFTWSGVRCLLVHGHQHQVKHSLLPLFYKAREAEAQLVIFGHTHRPCVQLMEGVLFVNPGSLVKPRGITVGTYALFALEAARWSLSFYTDQHERLELWSQEGSWQDGIFT